MKILIIYSTIEGHTREICKYIRDEALKLGLKPELINATEDTVPPVEYDAVIIAASVYMNRYQDSFFHYVKENHSRLNNTVSAFLSVSLTAASDEPESWNELRSVTEHFLGHTGWEPDVVEYAAGALLYTKYDFMKKFIMRLISKRSGGETDTSQDHIYTDWNQIKEFLVKVQSLMKEKTG